MNEWVSTISLLIAFLGVVWKMSKDIRDEHNATIKAHDADIARVYERFDEYKKNVEATHVSKEVFSLTYSALIKDIGEIKSDVKSLLSRQ